jgi:hypothetical protein
MGSWEGPIAITGPAVPVRVVAFLLLLGILPSCRASFLLMERMVSAVMAGPAGAGVLLSTLL